VRGFPRTIPDSLRPWHWERRAFLDATMHLQHGEILVAKSSERGGRVGGVAPPTAACNVFCGRGEVRRARTMEPSVARGGLGSRGPINRSQGLLPSLPPHFQAHFLSSWPKPLFSPARVAPQLRRQSILGSSCLDLATASPDPIQPTISRFASAPLNAIFFRFLPLSFGPTALPPLAQTTADASDASARNQWRTVATSLAALAFICFLIIAMCVLYFGESRRQA
jgi:hypothetical protein